MMIIFWDEDGVKYLPHGTTTNGPYYAPIIERLRSVIVEKGRGKVNRGVLLLHDNAPHLQVQHCSGCYSPSEKCMRFSIGFFLHHNQN